MKIQIKDLNPKYYLLSKIDTSINDKLSYCVKKTISKIEEVLSPLRGSLQEQLDDFKFDLADVDEKKHLLKDDKGELIFTVDNLKKITLKQRELNLNFSQKEVEFTPHLCKKDDISPDRLFLLDNVSNVKLTLDDFTIEELKGILFE